MNASSLDTARSSSLERFLGVSVFALCVLGMGVGVVLALTKTKQELTGLAVPVLILSFAVVGVVLVFRLKRNSLGWLFLIVAASFTMTTTGEGYAARGLVEAPGSLPAAHFVAWIVGWAFLPMAASLTVLLPLLFPTGRLLSRRWRPVLWLVLIALVLSFLNFAFERNSPIEGYPAIQNPYEIPSLAPLLRLLQAVAQPALLVAVAGAIASLVVRYRRSQGVERQQMKWFLFACAVIPLPFLTYYFNPNIANIALLLFAPLIPVAIGIAILKYRLYDIDVVINKTLVYGALAVFITAVYAGLVVGVGSLVGSSDRPNLGLSLAATAIVAVAFQPVRERVQRFANKLVYGERVTPYEAITSFSNRMAESLTTDQVLPQMAEAAARGVGGVRSRVRLLLPAGGEQVVTWPSHSSGDSFDRTIAVVHQGQEVGEIAVAKAPGEQINKNEDKLLQDLASQAGLAMRNLRLTGELQQKLIELQASRQRIVKAQDEERRRMERDIHDGAQQQLVSMSVKLGLAKNLLAKDLAKSKELLDQVKQETFEAVESLRDLARGLFPQVLSENGLRAAIQSHIQKIGLDARVDDRTQSARFDPEVEANIYFCIREALQNASKHAPGAPVTITLAENEGLLEFSVKDEGPGFDPNKVERGSGLENMADRVEALGGSLRIASRAGQGTEIIGRIPAKRLEPIE